METTAGMFGINFVVYNGKLINIINPQIDHMWFDEHSVRLFCDCGDS